MVMQRDRRTFLKSVGGMMALALPGVAGMVYAQDVQIRNLTPNLSLINAGGINQLAFAGADGVVLVDSGPASANEALGKAIAQLDKGPVATLFNTHWHPEQVGGNAMLKEQGARIVAHQKTLQHLSTRYYLPPEERYHEPLPELAWPTDIFHDHGRLEIGGETVDYGWLVQPHTDGDIYVYFRDANVLAAGDALAPVMDPELDWYGGGWLGGRVNSLDHLLAITDADTRIVPAVGPVMTRDELQAERDLMQEVYDRLLDLVRQGCSATCMRHEGALDGLSRTWNDPDKFLYAAYKGLWAHHYNLAPNIL